MVFEPSFKRKISENLNENSIHSDTEEPEIEVNNNNNCELSRNL